MMIKWKYEFAIIHGILILMILLSGCIQITTESGGDSLIGLYRLTSSLLCILLLITPIIVAFLVLYAGFQYAASADDPSKRAEAKNMIFNAILGLIIIIGIAYTAAWLAPNIDLGACF